MSFFDDVNNVNIFGFTKTVQNMPKLRYDLENDPVVGDDFHFLVADADKIRIHCKNPLDQTKIDALNAVINGFVETSAFDTELNRLNASMQKGFDLYKRIFTNITLENSLAPTLDEAIRLYTGYSDVLTMVIPMKDVRCMLKDNMYESTLRAFSVFLDPTHNFSAAEVTLYQDWLADCVRDADTQLGVDPAVTEGKIVAIKTAPKGAI